MNAPTLPEWMTVQGEQLNITFTVFPNVNAQSKLEQSSTWQQLAERLTAPATYPDKHACPLFNLMTFGDLRSPKDSLRHDDNVLSVTGIVADYDGEQVTLTAAAAVAAAAGLSAIFYTSASHSPAKPRWRITVPLSAPVPPAERAALLARLDALYGGILAPESYTLSLTYFFGRVDGVPFESAVVGGVPLDLADLPEAVPRVKQSKASKVAGNWKPLPADIAEVLAMQPCPTVRGNYKDGWLPTVLGALNSFGPAAVPALVEWSMPYYRARFPGKADEVLMCKAVAEVSARLQQEGDGKASWENVRERAGLPRVDVTGLFKPVEPAADDWPELRPVPDVILPAPVFDYAMLPAPFVEWVKDIATRKSWAPDYIAVSVMSLCGSLLGRKVALLPDDKDPTWQLIPNLWGLLIGTPSSAKSPSIEEALRLLKPVAADAEALFVMLEKAYTRELKFHRAKVTALEAKRAKALKDGDEQGAREIHNEISEMEDAFNLRRPKRRKFFSTDATYEVLFSLMVDNPQGLMLYKDEMSNLMAQMTMENFAMLRSFLMAAWKGTTTATKDRVKDEDKPLPAVEACISVLGGLQPSLLPRFLGGSRDGSEGDDGFPQRFGLMVWPDEPPMAANEAPKDMGAEKTAADVIRRLEQWPLKDEPMTYGFDGPTQRMFNLWNSTIFADNRSGATDPNLVTWLGKYPKTIASIALITALVEGRTVVDAQAWSKAMMWEKFLRGHLERVMDYSTRRATQHAKNIIRKIAESNPGEERSITSKSGDMVFITSRALTNRQLPGCSSTKETDDLLEWLEELGYVRWRGAGVVKGVKKVWEVRPGLFEK